jgi:tRNA(Ile)-lysidine synthase
VPAAENRPVSVAEVDALLAPFADLPVFVISASGGPDSTALLWLAARWRKARRRGPRLIAVTVDHGLRPEAKREARAVAALARKLGVAHRTVRWSGPKPRSGLQEAAREARYRLLAKAARNAGANCVATAHTLDDQAETILFRLSRGSGVGGLAGMDAAAPLPFDSSGSLLLVRPLLRVPKSRLLATLKAARLPYADDPSNRDPRFARPRWRALMPALEAEGLTAERLARLARRVARLEEAVQHVVRHAAIALAPGQWGAGHPVKIEAARFFDLPDEIALRLLGRAVGGAGNEGPVELAKLEALYEALLRAPATKGVRRTLAGAVVTLSRGSLSVERAPARRSAAKRP